jgi:hypothetical protein
MIKRNKTHTSSYMLCRTKVWWWHSCAETYNLIIFKYHIFQNKKVLCSTDNSISCYVLKKLALCGLLIFDIYISYIFIFKVAADCMYVTVHRLLTIQHPDLAKLQVEQDVLFITVFIYDVYRNRLSENTNTTLSTCFSSANVEQNY